MMPLPAPRSCGEDHPFTKNIMTRYFGAHTVDNGGIHMAVRRAAGAGATALQIFTAIPKYYGDKSSIQPERVERFRAALAEAGIAPEHVDGARRVRAQHRHERRDQVGPRRRRPRQGARALDGARRGRRLLPPRRRHRRRPRPAATERVARAITQALSAVPGATRLLVENTAGAGRTIGQDARGGRRDPRRACRPRSARAPATGSTPATSSPRGTTSPRRPTALTALLDEFEAATGEPPAFFHLNDSEGALGSNKDRHMLIGEGRIGVEPFRWLLADRRSAGIPLILETPQEQPRRGGGRRLAGSVGRADDGAAGRAQRGVSSGGMADCVATAGERRARSSRRSASPSSADRDVCARFLHRDGADPIRSGHSCREPHIQANSPPANEVRRIGPPRRPFLVALAAAGCSRRWNSRPPARSRRPRFPP